MFASGHGAVMSVTGQRREESAKGGPVPPSVMVVQVFNLFVPEAVGDMIIYHSHGLHEGVTNGRANKGKTPLF